jgi:hypothetical protein
MIAQTVPYSATELAQYRRDGYVLPRRPVFDDATFARLTGRFAELLEIWTGHYGQRAEAMDKPHFLFPELYEFVLHREVLDLVEPLIGPDIGFFTSHFICKPPRTGQRVPWHEDSSYWRGIFDPFEDICTVWLALDPSDRANGCLRVIAGSQANGFSEYRPVEDPQGSVFGTEVRPEQVDESRAVDFVLEPNRCSVHHARIIHGSDANRSERRRCGFTMRYFSTRCRFLGGPMPEAFQIYLARGRDHAGNRYGEPGAVNRAWIDQMLAGKVPPSHI